MADKSAEIRAEEKSRGGMAYEMILAEPIVEKPASPLPTLRQKSINSAEDIKVKLLQAEERRKSVEADRVSSISERLNRIDEAVRKRAEANAAFVAATQEALEEKQCAFASNREAYLNDLRKKIAEHLNVVENVKNQIDSQTKDIRAAIEKKLNTAQENRDEHLRKYLDKIKEHDIHSKKLRSNHQVAISLLDEKIQNKLDAAETKRTNMKMEKLELLKERDRKIEVVRANKEKLLSESKSETPSSC